MAEHKTPSLDWRWCLALALLALVAHFGALRAGLVYDDGVLVADNPFLRDGGNLASLFSPYQDRLHRGYFAAEELSWRPVATALHLVEFQLFGLDASAPPNAVRDSAAWLHGTSLLLHALVTVGCFGFLGALRLPKHAAFAGAALFAVHPLGVEPVLMVSFREDVLATGFLLGAAWLVALGPSSWRRAAGIGALVFMACGSKESALVAPGLLALIVWARRAHSAGDSPATMLRPWFPATVCVAAAWAVFVLLRFAVITNPGEGRLEPLPGGLPGLVAADLWILGQYCWTSVLPWTLLIDRTVPNPVPWLGMLAGLTALGVAGCVAWRARRGRPGVAAGLAWIGLALLPVMNLIPVSIPLAERFLYLPGIGAAWIVAALVAEWVPRLDHPRSTSAVAIAAVIAVACIARDHRRAHDFADDATLWAATYHANPDSARACANHGLLERHRAEGLLDQQRIPEGALLLDEVVRLHERAVELDPGERANRMKLAQSLSMRARLRTGQGRAEASAADLERAIAQVRRVLAEEATRSLAWARLGDLLAQRGGAGADEESLACFRTSMELEPLQLEPRQLYARRLVLVGHTREALAVMDATPAAQRRHPYWFATRAWVLQALGDLAGEKQTLEEGLAAFPGDPQLGQAYWAATGAGRPPR